jgi:hypothetical protein
MSIAQAFNPASQPQMRVENARNPRSGRTRPAQLATRTKWALDDILTRARRCRAILRKLEQWSSHEHMQGKGRYDVACIERVSELARLACELALEVAELERLAADARVGIYVGTVAEK